MFQIPDDKVPPDGDEQEAGHDDDDGDETALARVAPSSSSLLAVGVFLMPFLEGGVGEVQIAVLFPAVLLCHGILQSVTGNWVLFLSEAEKLGQMHCDPY